MSREICVRLYEKMRDIEGCPPVEIVMTGNVDKDPRSGGKSSRGANLPTSRRRKSRNPSRPNCAIRTTR